MINHANDYHEEKSVFSYFFFIIKLNFTKLKFIYLDPDLQVCVSILHGFSFQKKKIKSKNKVLNTYRIRKRSSERVINRII